MKEDDGLHREGDMVISLSPELEAALNEEARRRGIPPETLALEVLQERLLASVPRDETQDEWVRRLRSIATDCGVSLSNGAVSSEGIYE